MFNKKSISNEIYSKLGKLTTISTLDGVKILPHKLAIIIMFYKERTLERLFRGEMILAYIKKREFDTEKYESAAVKVRDYYNQIIYFYDAEFNKYLKTC